MSLRQLWCRHLSVEPVGRVSKPGGARPYGKCDQCGKENAVEAPITAANVRALERYNRRQMAKDIKKMQG
jgi:hypothetical protein